MCHHGIGQENPAHGWATTDLNAMKGHLDYLDQNRSKIWIETFGNVARYIRERDSASVTKKDSIEGKFTISVTDNLPDSIYDYPLTIRRPLPDGWTTAYVKQDGKAMDDTIVTVESKQYVMFKAVPDGGDVTISKDSGGVAVSSILRTGKSSPAMTIRNGILQIDRQRFGSDAILAIFTLQGKALGRRTLGAQESRIALPRDVVGGSTLLVSISGAGKRCISPFVPQL